MGQINQYIFDTTLATKQTKQTVLTISQLSKYNLSQKNSALYKTNCSDHKMAKQNIALRKWCHDF